MDELLTMLAKNGAVGGLLAAIALYFFRRADTLEDAYETVQKLRLDDMQETIKETKEGLARAREENAECLRDRDTLRKEIGGLKDEIGDLKRGE